MEYYNFLKMYGFRKFYSNNDVNAVISVINNSIRITDDNSNNSRIILGYLYLFIVFCIIVSYPIYIIIKSVTNLDYIFDNIFVIIIGIQYVYGLIYYNKNHLDDILNHYYNENIDNNISKLYLLPLIISILINIIFSVFVKINLFLIIWNLYGYCILFTNILTFILIFILYIQRVERFYEILKDKMMSSENINLLHIVNDYSKLKNSHYITVVNLNNIFSSIILCGFIFIYVIFVFNKTSISTVIDYINAIILILTILSYFFIITKIKSIVSDIKIFINIVILWYVF